MGATPPTFFDEIIQAGWDPLNPSADCIDAAARPPMPEYLSGGDRVGIHEKLLSIDLVRRFPSLRKGHPGDNEARAIAMLAALLAIRAAGRDLSTLTKEQLASHLEAIREWDEFRYRPAQDRFEAIRRAGLGPQDVRGRERELEPALTFNLLLHEKGWTDFEGNREAAMEALRLAEQRGVLPKQVPEVRSDLAASKMTDDDVSDLIGLLLSKNKEQDLFHVTGEGKFRLGAREGRDALESVVGAIEPVHQENSEPLPEEFDSAPDSKRTPADESAERELAALARQCIQEHRDSAPSDPIVALVAENFERLKRGEISARGLAEEAGVDRKAIDRELETLRTMLVKRFGGDAFD